VRRAPRGTSFQRGGGRGVVPAIAIAPFERNFIYVVVNAFVAVAENRTVAADFVVRGQIGAGAGRWCQTSPVGDALSLAHCAAGS
jgi:hypothetical protein